MLIAITRGSSRPAAFCGFDERILFTKFIVLNTIELRPRDDSKNLCKLY